MVRNCAPTLAAIKTGSLFSVGFRSREEMRAEIDALDRGLHSRGLRLRLLRWRSEKALVYLYRPERLARDLRRQKAAALLRRCGYAGCDPEQALEKLTQRLREDGSFPHEIGLFLGYPPEDVCGFIENGARNFKCCGCWKVYGDEQEARRTFDSYRRCTEAYCRLWRSGCPLSRLAVQT